MGFRMASRCAPGWLPDELQYWLTWAPGWLTYGLQDNLPVDVRMSIIWYPERLTYGRQDAFQSGSMVASRWAPPRWLPSGWLPPRWFRLYAGFNQACVVSRCRLVFCCSLENVCKRPKSLKRSYRPAVHPTCEKTFSAFSTSFREFQKRKSAFANPWLRKWRGKSKYWYLLIFFFDQFL